MKQFEDLEDWKSQFLQCTSPQVQIGMIHALFSCEDFSKWKREDLPSALEWASRNTGDDRVMKKIVQMLVTSGCSGGLSIKHDDTVLRRNMQLLGSVSEWKMVVSDDGLVRHIHKFLRLIAELGPVNDTGCSGETCDFARVFICYGQQELLNQAKWLGNPDVIGELKSELPSDIAFSEIIKKSPCDPNARSLAIHLAAIGKLDDAVTELDWPEAS